MAAARTMDVQEFIDAHPLSSVQRRLMLLASVVCFGSMSVASAFANDIVTLNWLRFVTGLGLGGAMPTAITLTSEFCPTSRRSSLVTICSAASPSARQPAAGSRRRW